jgi:uncharacterized cupin superfamily protein
MRRTKYSQLAKEPVRLDFRCRVCGADACYGAGVSLLKGELGRWYCAQHWHSSQDGLEHAMWLAKEASGEEG